MWELGLEYSLILEAALRELKRHQVGVVLVLGPNAAGIPEVAYEGLADRLGAYTVIHEGVRFVEPAEIAGKTDAQIRAAIETHLADPKRGVHWLVASDDRIVSSGLLLFSTAPDFNQLGTPWRLPFAIGYCCPIQPAIADGRIFIRLDFGLACYDLRQPTAQQGKSY